MNWPALEWIGKNWDCSIVLNLSSEWTRDQPTQRTCSLVKCGNGSRKWHAIGIGLFKDWGQFCQSCANPLRLAHWSIMHQDENWFYKCGPIRPPSRPMSNLHRSFFNRLETQLSSKCLGLALLLPMRGNARPMLCQFHCSWYWNCHLPLAVARLC